MGAKICTIIKDPDDAEIPLPSGMSALAGEDDFGKPAPMFVTTASGPTAGSASTRLLNRPGMITDVRRKQATSATRKKVQLGQAAKSSDAVTHLTGVTDAMHALLVGARGYVSKAAAKQDLLDAIETVGADRSFSGSNVTEILLKAYLAQPNRNGKAAQ
jgi:DNA-binding NarL/FixJ family response regulator